MRYHRLFAAYAQQQRPLLQLPNYILGLDTCVDREPDADLFLDTPPLEPSILRVPITQIITSDGAQVYDTSSLHDVLQVQVARI